MASLDAEIPESDIEMESGSEMEGDEGDSDVELQIALRDGLLKSDSLNLVGEMKRPPINKKAELEKAIREFNTKQPWIETLDITLPSSQNLTMEVINDDFAREIAFYKQAVESMKLALPRLKKLKVPIFRPEDYYAEMAKSDDHMQKVRKRLMEEKEMRQRQETIRRIREEKKYSTSVQREVLANRQSEKKKLADAVKKHRKGMKTQLETMLHNAEQMVKDDEGEDEPRGPRRVVGAARAQTARKMSRSVRDKRFGFGGQKKRSKRNDKDSFASFDGKKGGKKGGKGGKR